MRGAGEWNIASNSSQPIARTSSDDRLSADRRADPVQPARLTKDALLRHHQGFPSAASSPRTPSRHSRFDPAALPFHCSADYAAAVPAQPAAASRL